MVFFMICSSIKSIHIKYIKFLFAVFAIFLSNIPPQALPILAPGPYLWRTANNLWTAGTFASILLSFAVLQIPRPTPLYTVTLLACGTTFGCACLYLGLTGTFTSILLSSTVILVHSFIVITLRFHPN